MCSSDTCTYCHLNVILIGSKLRLRPQVGVDASVDHPFFVIGEGWSSVDPQRTKDKYDLDVRQLQVMKGGTGGWRGR